MREIVKYNNNQFSEGDLLYNEAYKYSLISFDELINELSMVVPREIIMSGKVRKMLDKNEKIVTMNFTYYLKGRQVNRYNGSFVAAKQDVEIALLKSHQETGTMIKQERMDYIEVGAAFGKPRKFKEKTKYQAEKEKIHEKIFDEWFKNLTTLQQADVAYNLWEGATFEEKKEEYLAM